MFRRVICWLVGLYFGLVAVAWAEVPVPPLTARVTDLTSTLSAEQVRSLEARLRRLEANSSAQMAVLLVPTTQPESIEQYSMRVVEAWKLGQKAGAVRSPDEADQGLLLLVAKNDRKVRIEVGYGLEGMIPDAIARRIIDETITPRFKRSDFAGGLQEGVQRIEALVVGGRDNLDSVAVSDSADGDAVDDAFDTLFDIPPWLVFVLFLSGPLLRSLLGRLFGGLILGGIVCTTAWLVSGQIAVAIIFGLAAFVFVAMGSSRRVGGGFGGSSGSSRGWGGGGGGGGFSGGGGSFGGGGASGSW